MSEQYHKAYWKMLPFTEYVSGIVLSHMYKWYDIMETKFLGGLERYFDVLQSNGLVH